VQSVPVNPFEAEFVEKGIRRGAELYLPVVEAIRLVERYREGGIVVLGAEGFVINDNGTCPQLDQILDLSSLTDESSWAEAEAFLTARLHSPYMFVVVASC
jgi:hypothetical protein